MVMRMFLLIELCVVLVLLATGKRGIGAFKKFRQEQQQLQIKIIQEEEAIHHLKNEVFNYQNDEFYKEKEAREALHMARANEQIYVY